VSGAVTCPLIGSGSHPQKPPPHPLGDSESSTAQLTLPSPHIEADRTTSPATEAAAVASHLRRHRARPSGGGDGAAAPRHGPEQLRPGRRLVVQPPQRPRQRLPRPVLQGAGEPPYPYRRQHSLERSVLVDAAVAWIVLLRLNSYRGWTEQLR
jgi:hypothetical protein